MARRFKEFEVVRLLERQEGPGNYSLGEVCVVPAGETGTILNVFEDGAAFEVDFDLNRSGGSHIITLRPDQIEPAA
ncbi:DUF4926 domain-containing protein [Pseudodesulfovibrio pelocollis]|uniref:DUF4926 domain-containing protein n=1 Tax=Pseudodesulfovibrio pelocollis TaxID=3051432 RepID=UPI00255AAC50|nr:DUF4926 domain-containing protein [Pseudodesulfovibrio sp. SB368]